MEQRDKPRTISAFEHENAVMHYGMVNHRSMIMLIAVCVTFIIITLTFVVGYTIRETSREKNWLDTLTKILPATTEVTDDGGIYEQSYP